MSILHDRLLTNLPVICLQYHKFQCPFHNFPPLKTRFSLFTPVHTHMFYFLKMCFNIILHSTFTCTNRDLFRPKFRTHVSYYPLLLSVPSILSSPHPNTKVKTTKFDIFTVITVLPPPPPPPRPNSHKTVRCHNTDHCNVG